MMKKNKIVPIQVDKNWNQYYNGYEMDLKKEKQCVKPWRPKNECSAA